MILAQTVIRLQSVVATLVVTCEVHLQVYATFGLTPNDVTSGILVDMEGLNGRDESLEMRRNSRGVASLSVSPPLGLQAIYSECSRVYPDQPNPLQVTAVVKYW